MAFIWLSVVDPKVNTIARRQQVNVAEVRFYFAIQRGMGVWGEGRSRLRPSSPSQRVQSTPPLSAAQL